MKNVPLSGIEEIDSGITTTHGSVPWSVKDVVKTTKQTKTEPADYCPITKAHCGEACAAYTKNGCVITEGGKVTPTGLCPVTQTTCKSDRCIMFREGDCILLQRGKG